MKKRTFLLFEALLALALVVACVVPLVKQPLQLYKDEINSLEGMEEERLADWTFTEIKELLLKNEIPWKEIPEKGTKTNPFPLPSAMIQIPGCKPKVVERSFTLFAKAEKVNPPNELYRHLHICVTLNEESYTFRLPIRKFGMEQ